MVLDIAVIGGSQSVVVRLKIRPPDYACYAFLQLSATEVKAQRFLLAISEALPESWIFKFESIKLIFLLFSIYLCICTDNFLKPRLMSEADGV